MQIDRDLAQHWREIEIQNEDIALVAEEDSLIGFVAVWCRPIPFIDNLHVRPDRFGTKYESVIVSGEVDEVFDINKQNAMEGLLHKYSIDKAYARNLDHKVKAFEEKTATQKQIFLTMITTLGLKRNFYSEELVDSEVVLTDLIS